ncbi:hypothetical protein CIK89_02610 [Prevotella sp. P4-119]|nr:hypothetical protein CIK89_02610 [Prevotella sp. P4-119]
MQLILFLYLKTTSMRINWKRVALYVLRVIELVITGAAGGAMSDHQFYHSQHIQRYALPINSHTRSF